MGETPNIFCADQPKSGTEDSTPLYTGGPEAFTLKADLNLLM